jgi:hypothetical protein
MPNFSSAGLQRRNKICGRATSSSLARTTIYVDEEEKRLLTPCVGFCKHWKRQVEVLQMHRERQVKPAAALEMTS